MKWFHKTDSCILKRSLIRVFPLPRIGRRKMVWKPEQGAHYADRFFQLALHRDCVFKCAITDKNRHSPRTKFWPEKLWLTESRTPQKPYKSTTYINKCETWNISFNWLITVNYSFPSNFVDFALSIVTLRGEKIDACLGVWRCEGWTCYPWIQKVLWLI